MKPWREEGHRITLFNTTDHNELERAAALLRVIPLLRQSRVLCSPPFKGTPASYDAGSSESAAGGRARGHPRRALRRGPGERGRRRRGETGAAVARRGRAHGRADAGGRRQGCAGESGVGSADRRKPRSGAVRRDVHGLA